MSEMQATAFKYISELSHEKLQSALDYLRFLREQTKDYPLDDFDYELARRADEAMANGDIETISFEDAIKAAGLTMEDFKQHAKV